MDGGGNCCGRRIPVHVRASPCSLHVIQTREKEKKGRLGLFLCRTFCVRLRHPRSARRVRDASPVSEMRLGDSGVVYVRERVLPSRPAPRMHCRSFSADCCRLRISQSCARVSTLDTRTRLLELCMCMLAVRLHLWWHVLSMILFLSLFPPFLFLSREHELQGRVALTSAPMVTPWLPRRAVIARSAVEGGSTKWAHRLNLRHTPRQPRRMQGRTCRSILSCLLAASRIALLHLFFFFLFPSLLQRSLPSQRSSASSSSFFGRSRGRDNTLNGINAFQINDERSIPCKSRAPASVQSSASCHCSVIR